MVRIVHISNAHASNDPRIFERHCTSLANNGFEVLYLGPFGFINEINQGVKIVGIGKTQSRFVRFTYINFKILTQIFRLKPDVVEFHDPDLVLLAGFLKFFGFKIIGNIHEDISLQVLNKYWIPKIFRKLLHKFFSFFYPILINLVCDATVCATDGISEKFKNNNNIVTRNFPTKNFFNGCKIPKKIIKEKLNLIYVGVVEDRRGLDIMLKISRSKLVSKLTLVGKFSPKSLKKKIQQDEKNNKKLKIIGEVPYGKVPEFIKKNDVGICLLENNRAYSESIPTKIFEYSSLGLPTISNNFKYISDLNNKNSFAILIDEINIKSVENALERIINKYYFYSSSCLEASKLLNWNNEESKYLDLMKKIV